MCFELMHLLANLFINADTSVNTHISGCSSLVVIEGDLAINVRFEERCE